MAGATNALSVVEIPEEDLIAQSNPRSSDTHEETSAKNETGKTQNAQGLSSLSFFIPLIVTGIVLLALIFLMANVLFNIRNSVNAVKRDTLLLQSKVQNLETALKNLSDSLPQSAGVSQYRKAQSGNFSELGKPENGNETPTVNDEPFVLEHGASTLNGLSFQNARAAYKALIAGNKIVPDPICLKAEATSSLSDMFGKGEVFLGETEHGAFVLLRASENDKKGWVLPNPALYYRGEALRPVFPNLLESDFNNNKNSIDPVAVMQVGKGRWIVGSDK